MLLARKSIKQLGFTLIELMVVIAIIGLLMAAGLVAYTNIQKNARDSRRIQDVAAIAAAAEQYLAANSVYPATIAAAAAYFSAGTPTTPTGGTVVTGGPAATAYEYTVDVAATPTKYCVCTAIEAATRGNATANAAGVCTFATTAQNRFCVGSQQ